MNGFTISGNRLVKWLKQSRDNWKSRAAEKQKRIRSLNVKVRDLLLSRDHWQVKAKVLQLRIKKLEALAPPSDRVGGSFGEPPPSSVDSPAAQSTGLISAPPFCPRRPPVAVSRRT